MAHWTAGLVSTALQAMWNRPRESSRFGAIFDDIAGRPAKAIAAFMFAPFLLLRLAFRVKDPVRRGMAFIGILASILAAYLAGTLLGSLVAGLLIALKVGLIWGLGFLIGSYFSVVLTVCFQTLIFNAVARLFLRMSQQDVCDYLAALSA